MMKKTMALSLLLVASVFLITACYEEVYEEEHYEDIFEEEVQEDDFETPEEPEIEQEESIEEYMTAALNDLVALGSRLHCTAEGEGEEGEPILINLYLDGERYRMNVESLHEGTELEAFTIFDGQVMYSWNSETPFGMMMDLSGFEDVEAPEDAEPAEAEQKFDYRCGPWVPVSSYFVPPADVDFWDMGEMLEGMGDDFDYE
ncbi:MAG TPA: hypothetical protein ENN46_04125 [Candidatus Woesearchaeota archaeon]|nr:hypothetical protein [Candidatus Woesearchaeota archaeon]